MLKISTEVLNYTESYQMRLQPEFQYSD